MARSSTWLSAVAFVLIVSGWALGQASGPNDGVQAFSTHEWGIDLASSALHVSFPLRSKAGDIPYSSSVDETVYYSVVINNGTPYWVLWPDPFYGPSFADTARQASFKGIVSAHGCNPTPPFYYWDGYTVTSITDGAGTVHPLQQPAVWIRNNNSSACSNHQQLNPVTEGVTDNSGYTLYVNTTGSPIVYDKAGRAYTVPVPFFTAGTNLNFSSLASAVSDPNGATISGGTATSGTLGGAVTDTLNTTVVNVNRGGGGGGLAINNASYTDASGTTQQQYTMVYTALTVRSNFGCSPRVEYGGNTLLTSVQTPTGGSYTISYEPTPGNSGAYTGRISQISFPTGGAISYAYSDTNGHNGMDCSNQLFPFVPTITVTVNDNNGTSSTYTYVHSVPAFNSSSFTVTKTDPAGNQTVYTFWSRFQTQVQYYQGPATGTPLKTVLTCYNGNTTNCANPSSGIILPITQTDVYTSLGTSASNHVKTIYDSTENVTSVVAYDFGATSPTSQTYTFYGQSWNGTSCTPYPAGTYIADTPCYSHTENSAGADIAKTQITYSNTGHPTSGSEWKTGSSWLTGTATFNANGTVATSTDVNGALSTYAYNGTGGCNSMLPTSVTVTGTALPSGGLTSSTQWDCSGGVVTQLFDANNQLTTTNYAVGGVADPLYRPLSILDSLNNSTGFTYTPTTVESTMNFGTMSTTDSLVTTDGLGRNIFGQKRQSQGSSTFDSAQTAYGWINVSTGACTNQPPQPPQTTVACTMQSVPYAGTAGQPAPGGTAVTTTQIDAIGRPISTSDGGGGTISYVYTKNDVLQTASPAPSGENTKRKQLEYDGLGRLTSVCEITSATGSGVCGQQTSQTGFWTRYQYDAAGRLLGVCQNTTQPLTVDCVATPSAGQQTRTFTYDGLGRMTSETNPETGTTQYIYDTQTTTCGGYSAPGNLMERIDNAGTHICYGYDALHRLAGFSNSKDTNCVGFAYDAVVSPPTGVTVTYPKGHVVEALTNSLCNGHGSLVTDEWFSYSARGELTDVYESTPHSGGYYHTTAAFWANGALQSLGGIPGYATTTYGVDGEGRPTSAQQGATALVCDTSCSILSTKYNAGGQVVTINLGGTGTNGSGDNDTYTYDPNTGRMTNYAFTVGSTPKSMNGALTWNANGTLRTLAITDGFNAGGTQTCNYGTSSVMGYDDVGRLLSANCNSVWSQTFTYDPFGNITKSGSLAWQPGYNSATNQYLTPANCITAGGSPCYDADGNLLRDTANSYTWSAYGKMSSVIAGNTAAVCGTSGTCVTYDASGRPAETNTSGVYAEILYSPVGKIAVLNGSTVLNAYFPMPGGGTLRQNGAGTRSYQHMDWLGTARLESGIASRNLTYDRAFAPFGESYDTVIGGTANLEFAGLRQDLATGNGLFDTPNREYPANQGRWNSPDPAGLDAVNTANPQSWNHYAYVTNNPLNSTDPLGLDDKNVNKIREALAHACHPRGGSFTQNCVPWTQSMFDTTCFLDGIATDCSSIVSKLANGTAAICPLGSTCVFNDHGVFQLQPTADDGWTWARVNQVAPTGTIRPLKGQEYDDALNAYCSARGRAKFVADWIPGGGTIARDLWNSPTGAALGAYQLSTSDINRITEDNSGGQTIAMHGVSEGLKAAADSTAVLYALRANTGVPMTFAKTWLGRLSVAVLVADAVSGFYKEGKEILSCQAGN